MRQVAIPRRGDKDVFGLGIPATRGCWCRGAAGDRSELGRLRAAADAAVAEIPPYDWTFERTAALDFFNQHKQTLYAAPGFVPGPLEQDTEDALAYLLPDRRARFEVAVRRGPAGDTVELDPGSVYLRRARRGC